MICYCVHRSLTLIQTVCDMRDMYSMDCLHEITIIQWHQDFCEGCESAALIPQIWRPQTSVTETHVNTVAAVIATDLPCYCCNWRKSCTFLERYWPEFWNETSCVPMDAAHVDMQKNATTNWHAPDVAQDAEKRSKPADMCCNGQRIMGEPFWSSCQAGNVNLEKADRILETESSTTKYTIKGDTHYLLHLRGYTLPDTSSTKSHHLQCFILQYEHYDIILTWSVLTFGNWILWHNSANLMCLLRQRRFSNRNLCPHSCILWPAQTSHLDFWFFPCLKKQLQDRRFLKRAEIEVVV